MKLDKKLAKDVRGNKKVIAPPAPEPKVILTLKVKHINLILAGLGELPAKYSLGLMNKITEVAEVQLTPKPPKKKEAPKDNKVPDKKVPEPDKKAEEPIKEEAPKKEEMPATTDARPGVSTQESPSPDSSVTGSPPEKKE